MTSVPAHEGQKHQERSVALLRRCSGGCGDEEGDMIIYG